MLLGFFDEVRRRSPDRTAIEIPPGPARAARTELSYAALADRADAIAKIVAARIRPDAIAALLLPRTNPDAFAAQLGVLRAGGAYLALDPSFPEARVNAIISDASPVVLLTDAAGRLPPDWTRSLDAIVNLNDGVVADGAGGAGVSFRPAAASDLAYLIYTSGTSGRPKGVLVEHGAIANLVQSDLREFGLGEDDRVAQGSSHAYDSSIEETWLALAAGATAVVMNDENRARGAGSAGMAARRTHHRAVPAADPAAHDAGARGRLLAGPPADLRRRRGAVADLVEVWAPGRRFVNGYGPTECAVTAVRGDVRCRRAGLDRTAGARPPRHILDEALRDVTEGARGELCLEGAGLARGYQDCPTKPTRGSRCIHDLRPPLSHRRSGASRRGGHLLVSRPHRHAGQAAWLSHRTRGNRLAPAARARSAGRGMLRVG
jgi:non-ribosomal peptide synthetase component F